MAATTRCVENTGCATAAPLLSEPRLQRRGPNVSNRPALVGCLPSASDAIFIRNGEPPVRASWCENPFSHPLSRESLPATSAQPICVSRPVAHRRPGSRRSEWIRALTHHVPPLRHYASPRTPGRRTTAHHTSVASKQPVVTPFALPFYSLRANTTLVIRPPISCCLSRRVIPVVVDVTFLWQDDEGNGVTPAHLL
jgi:hypothetical protein